MTEWLLGTVVTAENGELAVQPDGADAPLRRSCLFPVGVAPAEGMRVLLCRYAGVCLVAAAYRGTP